MKTKPSKDLEEEIMRFIFSNQCEDHNEALETWKKNPWEAVGLYELAHYPHTMDLPLVTPKGVQTPDQTKADLDALLGLAPPKPVTHERAEGGEYELDDGVIAIVNKFGRVTNPEDIWDEN